MRYYVNGNEILRRYRPDMAPGWRVYVTVDRRVWIDTDPDSIGYCSHCGTADNLSRGEAMRIANLH